VTVDFNQLRNIEKTILQSQKKIELLIVTKNRSRNDVLVLLENGYRVFGENKVQEASLKFDKFIADNYSDTKLHLIGPLQSNKAKLAASTFDVIQSIDRKKIIDIISKEINENLSVKTKEFYIQINIGKEIQKFGVLPENVAELYDYALYKKINIVGLMCIPPNNDFTEDYFKQMINIKNSLNRNLKLSMGMSSDYELAIKNSSDLVRIGSLIFN
tara:strand:+ start:8563 stop:9207 length:645 start_codon:yes stop_codon:yes gene_type:complete